MVSILSSMENHLQSTLKQNLDFLTTLYREGLSYSAINSASSALSALGIIQEGFTVGSHPIVVRFMKGINNL